MAVSIWTLDLVERLEAFDHEDIVVDFIMGFRDEEMRAKLFRLADEAEERGIPQEFADALVEAALLCVR